MLFGIQEPVSAAIWHLLNTYNIEDAIFLAERLHAEVKSEESIFLLATCYFRDGQKEHALHTLEKLKRPSPKSCILLARCYLEQKEFRRVQPLLIGNSAPPPEEVNKKYQSDTGMAYWLIGESLRRSNMQSDSLEFFLLSLQFNPYLWSSLHALCEAGHPVNLDQFYIADNCPVFCSEVPYIAVPRSSSSESVISPEFPSEQRDSLLYPPLPLPMESADDRAKKSQIRGVAMKLSFDSAFYGDKNIEKKSALLSPCTSGSPATPCFGYLPHLSTPDLQEDTLGLERSGGNVSWLVRQLKETHLFSSYHTPSPQAFPHESSLLKAPLIPKPMDVPRSEAASPSEIRSLAAPAPPSNPEFRTPDPPPSRFGRKRDVKFASAAPENEPKHKIRRQDPSQGQKAAEHRPVTRSFRKQDVSPQTHGHTPSESRLPLPSKLALKPRRGNKPDQSKLVKSTTINQIPNAPTPSHDTPASSMDHSVLLDQGQTEEFNSALMANLQSVVNLLRQLAQAYILLYRFECSAAVSAFRELPERHYRTPWVLCQVAKAHFEQANYKLSCEVFDTVRHMDPDHVTDMDIYSTALWHLQRDVELCVLSEELADCWYLSPQAWCAKGNCLSILKEHEDAIKFFRRATQVAPRFVYAYTLLGHEYLCNEDLSNARKSFRIAATINPRHYNAWFGLGMISLREENFPLAQTHFSTANSINGSNCMINCRLAKVKHSLNQSAEALLYLEKARKLNPKNPVPLYHKGSILFDLNRPQEALNVLEELVKMVPREALVHYLMGRVYQKLGKKFEAKLKFSWALSIDPNNREIRDAQNSLNQPAPLTDETTPPNSGFNIFIDPMPETPTPDENNHM